MKLLLSEEQIRDGIRKLAGKITTHYEGQPVTLVAVMTGSIILLADLMRQLRLPLELGVVRASSYRGEASTPGELSIDSSWLGNLSGRHVLVVDDIFDTGRTLRGVCDNILKKWQPASLRCAVLLRKIGRQEVVMQADFVGFEIPDVFVVGYGLDYNGAYRNLCHIAAMETDDLGRGESKGAVP